MSKEFIPLTQQEFETISEVIQESYRLDSTEHAVFMHLRRLVAGESIR